MLNKLVLYLIFFLVTYSTVFAIYFLIIVISAIIKRNKTRKHQPIDKYRNIVTIIYSHNNENTIVNLLEQLNKQNYPKGNYQTHIILDNCSDNSSNKLEFVGGAKLWRLKDEEPFGKDRAVSWLLDNLMSFKNVDAYVFLNANRLVRADFLLNINRALQEHDVVVGATEIFLENADYKEKVWANVNEYNVGIMKSGRAKLGLAVPVDSDVTIIKQEVLEKVKCIDFKDANSELKYSFLLTKVGYPPQFVPEVITYVSSENYEVKRPDFSFKMSLFIHCFNLNALSSFKFVEFLFSLFKPNPIILAAMLIIVSAYSFTLNDIQWAVFLGIILAVSFIASIYSINMLYIKQIIYLASCPVYTLMDTLCKMTFLGRIIQKPQKDDKEYTKPERILVPVTVTNGRSDFACRLELISDGGFKKAVFRYKKKKKSTTQSFVRMCDAVKNIADILEQHDFKIKICQTCAYFSPKIDGTDNMVKGYCNREAVINKELSEPPETVLWNCCNYFIPQEINNVIDISKFIKK